MVLGARCCDAAFFVPACSVVLDTHVSILPEHCRWLHACSALCSFSLFQLSPPRWLSLSRHTQPQGPSRSSCSLPAEIKDRCYDSGCDE